MQGFKRTFRCDQLRAQNVDQEVILNGWIKKRRDLGNLIFVDLRDREGITQIIFDPAVSPEAYTLAKELRSEFVVGVKGLVRSRGNQSNSEMATGEIEVVATALKIFSRSETPPFHLDDDEPTDDTRLKYRYLDIRREHIKQALKMRHQITTEVRNVLDREGFWEIETPMLAKSTPEGARDYLVPSRVHPENFYALPQSPQLLKQLLMVAGTDKYFQICRCFRDEDLRADRQPEFTQIDLEMSFADQDDVFAIGEKVIQAAIKATGAEVQIPFPKLTHAEALDQFGSDKPDLRFGMQIKDITDVVKDSSFKAFSGTAANGGLVKAICIDGGAALPRRKSDYCGEIALKAGAKGVITIKYNQDGTKKSALTKFLTDAEWQALEQVIEAKDGDLVLIAADSPKIVREAMGNIRLHLGQSLELIDEKKHNLVWITDFPLFHYSAEDQRWVSEHHPFTAPFEEDLPYLESDPGRVRSCSYDLVFNGFELASGSVRIHDRKTQEKIFEMLKLSPDEAQERFGFFLKALQFGAPPHAGIAFGLDRLVMILAGRTSLRDVIAFPKTQKATDLMMEAPATVRAEQLSELHIKSIPASVDK